MRPVEALGDYVKRRRTQLGLSLGDLAERSGVSKSLIGQLEKFTLQNPPKVENLHKLAKALGVADEVLLSLAEAIPVRPEALEAAQVSLTPLMIRIAEIISALPEEEQEDELRYLEQRAQRLPKRRGTPRGRADQ